MQNPGADAQLTRPAPPLPSPLQHAKAALEISILWHPDPIMLGARAWLDGERAAAGLDLGRHAPQFRLRDGRIDAPLSDPHISRRALRIFHRQGMWELEPAAGACQIDLDRCRLGARRRLADGPGQGAALRLGHNTLLWLRDAAPRPGPPPAPAAASLIGGGAAMCALRARLAALGETGLDVLLRGETGTGKDLAARAIHDCSPRRDGPFVAVNMAALPEGLAAAELFGARRGAFTGASSASEGHFLRAQGGTLFLDEIGDTPVSLQPLLLRALEAREVQVVGGGFRRVDVRVVSATELDLDGPGSPFRAALRHRLAVAEVVLPPLRERIEDLGELIAELYSAARHRLGLGPMVPLSDSREQHGWVEFVGRCAAHRWPGNVRELRNVLLQIALDGTPGRSLAETQPGAGAAAATARAVAEPTAAPDTARRDDARFREVWEQARFEPARAAALLGVSRPTVYRWLQRLPDCRLARDVPDAELARVLEQCGGDVKHAAERLGVSCRGLRQHLARATPPGVPLHGQRRD